MDMVILAILIVGFDIFLIWMVWRGAPFVPTKKEAVKQMVICAKVTPGCKALDIGSGDGRIVIALAQAGAEAHGIDNNPLLIWWSRIAIKDLGLEGKAFIHWGDFWKMDMSSFDVVTLFGVTQIMKPLKKKLERELKPGARVISNGFRFPDWTPTEVQHTVIAYEMGKQSN